MDSKAGYAIWNDTLVLAVGDTEDECWADLDREIAAACLTVEREGYDPHADGATYDDGQRPMTRDDVVRGHDSHLSPDTYRLTPATDRFVAKVRTAGGFGFAWRFGDGAAFVCRPTPQLHVPPTRSRNFHLA